MIRFVISFAIALQISHLPAADIADAEKLFRTGQYDDCIRLATEEIAKSPADENWWRLKIQAEAARGRYDDAAKTYEDGAKNFPPSLPLHALGYEVLRTSNRTKEAATAFALADRLATQESWRFRSPADRVALGRFLLATGTDAKKILEDYFNEIIKRHPDFIDTYLATAELALGKNDRAFAADILQKAPKEAATDPRFHVLFARAFADDDEKRATKAIDDALAINPVHADALLLRADDQMDSEDYTAAEASLKKVLDVDPKEPRAWAYRAVIAHLKGNLEGEKAAYETALSRWPGNADVDHRIGRKLSRNYRFAEGSAYQRKALAKEPKLLPAKVQLCQDLLRLGEEEEGWKLAAEVFAADGYNVVAFNLITLRDKLQGFRTIADGGFLLRMDAREADLYGPQALAVLKRARKTLTEKYGITLDKAITVEIFAKKQDFAVRTFGLPGAEGFLGVCFGPVITANSPASRMTSPNNWEAVLWHEFCHTVTLTKTNNKMPRWLSEGISVYEEVQANSGWGQWLTPRYREMILGDDLTPLSRLSSAFLNPKSPLHVQFAYYESAVAVEFLIERHGFESLKAILADLGAGVGMNEALERHAGGSLTKLDEEFANYIRAKATNAGKDLNWEKCDLPEDADEATIRAWLEKHPANFQALQRLGARLLKDQKWEDAASFLIGVQQTYPEYVGPGNTYERLAEAYRHTEDFDLEAKNLEELAKRDADAVAAFERLIEIGETANEPAMVAKNARRLLAVNPLTAKPHRSLAAAATKLGERTEAIAAYRACLQFAPPDAPDIHYRLAVLYDQGGERDRARREVLRALEDAPRSRDAHALLLKLTDLKPAALPTAPAPREITP